MQNNNLIDLKNFQTKKQKRLDEKEVGKIAVKESAKEKTEEFAKNKDSSKEQKKDFIRALPAPAGVFWPRAAKFFLYLLIFLLPLFFLPVTVYPVEANKQFLAIAFVLASFLCYLISIYSTRKIIYRKSSIFLATIFFVIAGGVSAVFSFAKNISLYGDFTRPDVFINFIIYGLVLFLVMVFFKKEDFNKIGMVFLASAMLVAVSGLLQMLGIFIFPFDFTKQIGFNIFGSFINFGIFIAFGLVLTIGAITELDLPMKIKIGLMPVGLFFAADLFIINEQLIWLLLSVVMIFFAVYKFTAVPPSLAPLSPALAPKVLDGKKKNQHFLFGSGAPLAVSVVCFLIALAGPSLPLVLAMPNLPPGVRPNLSATLAVSKETLKNSRIIIGSGLATFPYQYSLYRPTDLNQTVFWQIRFNQGFSFVSTYLTTAGLVGLFSVLLIIFAFGKMMGKNLHDKKAIIVSLGALFMLASWFFYPVSFVGLVFTFASLGLVAAMVSAQHELDFSRVSRGRAVIGFVAIAVLAAGGVSSLYFLSNKYIAAVYFQKGAKEYNAGNIAKAAENIARSAALDAGSDQYFRVLSQALILDAQNSRDLNLELSKDAKFQNRLADAVLSSKKAAEINPADSLNWNNLGSIYEKIMNIVNGADIFSESSYRKASELNPKSPDSLVDMARALLFIAGRSGDKDIKQQKLNEAKASLGKAIGLKPDYAPAHFQLALAYVQEENSQEAIKELELVKTLVDSDARVNFQLGALYYDNSQFDKARNEMLAAINLDSNFSNARYILGLIYDKEGQKYEAIEQFEKVLVLNPNNKEVESIINNLKTKGSAFLKDTAVPDERTKEALGGEETELIDNADSLIDIPANDSVLSPPQ